MSCLIFIENMNEADAILSAFKNSDQGALGSNRSILVVPGDCFAEIGLDCYSIRPNANEDYLQLLSSLPQLPEKVLYAWPWSTQTMADDNGRVGYYSRDIEAAFLLTKALLAQQPEHKIRLLYVYSNTDSSHPRPHHDAFVGFAKAITHESRKVCWRQLCLVSPQSVAFHSVLPAILNEFSCEGDDIQVRYVDGVRQRLVFREIPAPDKPPSGHELSAALPVRDGGIYIVTGGLGGLGYIVARHIASQSRVKLVLCGRSDRNDGINECLEELEFLGASCIYRQLDVSDAASVNALVEEVRHTLGPINGLFHCAGINRDALVKDKTLQDFRAVLHPKVLGTLNLDEATRNDPLDFVVYFSSISALLGNIGQSDYCYANSFLDHYSAWRNNMVHRRLRLGRSISVNWPLWKDGGMQVDEQVALFSERNTGAGPLSIEDGLNLLADVMRINNVSHVFTAKGTTEKLRNCFNIQGTQSSMGTSQPEQQPAQSSAPAASISSPPIPDTPLVSASGTQGSTVISSPSSSVRRNAQSVTDAEVLGVLRENLVTGIVEILEVAPKDVDIDSDLNNFGFDSITFTTFGNRIADVLDIEITPVVFFEYQTVRDLSEYMLEEHRKEILAWHLEHNTQPASQPDVTMQSSELSIQHSHIRQPEPLLSTPTPPIPTPAPLSHTPSAPKPQTSEPRTSEPLTQETPSPRVTDYAAAGTNSTSMRGHSSPRVPISQAVSASEPIAIIGIDGILPQSEDLSAFWKHLEMGSDLITEVPEARWSWRKVWGDPFKEKNRTKIKWGGFIPDVDKFDAAFFGLSPREAELMDPQHRLFLQVVWRCIEDAGYRASTLAETQKVGLFCGSASIDYHDIMVRSDIDIDIFSVTGSMFSVLVNRISYLLNFRGPSEPVETACSSSLVAVHRAIQSIRAGECDVALAGGIHLMLEPNVHIGLDKGGFLSPQGRCATFDKEADGYVRGEGAVALLLKPLSRAEEDGDNIHALIRGSMVNHGGAVNTLTTPNPNAQTEVIVEAWRQAGVDPETISYIEAHGTGTALGDPIEVKALRKALDTLYKDWGKETAPYQPHCGLGSVKSNIGHLEFVAGASGVAKMVMSMKHKILPATIHYTGLNPYIQLDNTPFFIQDKQQDWSPIVRPDGSITPLRAGVSSFGFGGVNSHVALESYDPAPRPVYPESPCVILLSAKDRTALQRIVSKLRNWLRDEENVPLSDIAFTLAMGREHMEERLLIVAQNRQDLTLRLDAIQSSRRWGEPIPSVYSGSKNEGKARFTFLKSKEEATNYAKSLVAQDDLPLICENWVDGLDINWDQTAYTQGYRTSLPTYPFAKTRHWSSRRKRHEANPTLWHLNPGNRLSQHQVKNNRWLTLLAKRNRRIHKKSAICWMKGC
ncbi:hypothetical protein CS022_20345 [Veronia nyctiphanis]|uniref:Uncharacterized protein n=1 Tax=Veronia nyctiphanis TaxID=1278244 RepID=A0A4Q0YRW4_9GAMM|nr:type I polyketide synthase [Veronia nyctiphanis]RXJ71691.1 hypothetical protein CS022_20345 [Veronia nyctiphanis]